MRWSAGTVQEVAPGAALAAVRARLGLVLTLGAVAAVGWVWTSHVMRGMDEGPWTSLGGLGWFLVVWVVMMAAMMFPSVAPTIALYTRVTKAASPAAPWLFAGGYLLAWATAGLLAWFVGTVTVALAGDALAWEHAGRYAAGATLLVAAAYELTPLKDVCLVRCRSPLGALLGSWHGGPRGSLRMGLVNGTWCVACCWALMASLFALGVMSVTWMALVAGIVAAEKMLPWRRAVTAATAGVLLALGVLLLAAPQALPGLHVPSGQTMRMG